MGSYLLVGKKGIYKRINASIETKNGESIGISTLTPVFTYDVSYEDSEYTKLGFRPLGSSMIKTDENMHGKDDTVPLLSTLTPEVNMVLDNLLAQGMDPEILLRYKLYRSAEDEVSEADYNINWTKKILTIKNSNKYATYRLVAYVNLAYLNNRLMETEYDDLTDQQGMSHTSIHGYDTK
jgi:hypothetical protein